MDHVIRDALRAIDEAERASLAGAESTIDAGYLRAIRAIEALPENQDGADKSWVWPVYEFCRRHFAQAEPACWTRSRGSPQRSKQPACDTS